MATDFNYNSKTINASGPLKPTGKDMPVDARTRVETYADIQSIPNPYVGMVITVLQDENNGNVMKDYKVKSLKSNELGVANTVIDEIVPYADYLGVSASSGSGEGLTTEQAQQLQTAYEHSQSTHVQTSDLENIDAVSLNGKKLSDPMTKAEYDAITDKDASTIYLVTDGESAIEGIPNYSSTEANKVLAVNSDGTALAWIDVPSGSGTGLTEEQARQLQTAYEHSQITHVQDSDIPSLEGYATETFVTNKIAEASLSGGEVDLSGYATKDDLTSKVDKVEGKSLSTNDLTNELKSNYDEAYLHSQSTHVQASDIPTKVSELENDSDFATKLYVNSVASSGGSTGTGKSYWLTGKKWVVLGDSITDATVNTKTEKYHKFVSELVGGCTVVNHGTSGITVNGLRAKLSAIDTTGVKLVTSFIGVNDWNFPIPLGKEGDTGTDTEYGVIYNYVSDLVKKFPRINILGIIPLPCQASNGVLQATCSEGFSLKQLTEALKYTYSLFSIPYLDLFNESNLHATIPSSRDYYLSDGLHPNVAYHKFMSRKILAFIENNVFDEELIESPVETITVTGVSLNKTSNSVDKGSNFVLTATITPSNATNKNVTFSSDNENISISQSGLTATITGNTAGSSIVTVTTEDGNKTATCNVTVTAASSGEGGETGGSAEDTMNVVSDGTATFKIGGINIETGNLIDSTAEARTSHCIPITLGDNNSITISSDLIGQSGGKFLFGMALYDENDNWLESTVGTNPATYWHSTSGAAVATLRKIYVNNATIAPPNNGLNGTPVKMKVSFTCVNSNTVLDLASIKGHTFTINGVTYTIQ